MGYPESILWREERRGRWKGGLVGGHATYYVLPR